MGAFLEKYRVLLFFVLLLVIGAGVATWLARQPRSPVLVVVTPIPSVARPAESSGATTREPVVKVYVSGAVANPGVYELRPSDRLEDAMKAAGGATAQADLRRVNLAAKVRDEQQIHVPTYEEPGPTPAPPSRSATKVNLNTATAAELEALRGIGKVTAEKILEYRQTKGPFKRVEELLEAKLVSQSTFNTIKDLVTAP